jgi:HD-like signal output (HDOD) protein
MVEIVLLNSVTKPMKSAQQGYGLEEGRLWKQSVSCALMASAIAETVETSKKHIVFTAALLKDIGVIVLDQHTVQVMATIRKTMEADGLSLVAAERQVLGIDHAHLGGRIAGNWNFSNVMVDTIQHHHLTDEVADIPIATAMVYLADSMCSMSGINAELFCGHYAHYDRVCEQLGLSEEAVNRIMSDFYSRKEDIYGLLAIL